MEELYGEYLLNTKKGEHIRLAPGLTATVVQTEPITLQIEEQSIVLQAAEDGPVHFTSGDYAYTIEGRGVYANKLHYRLTRQPLQNNIRVGDMYTLHLPLLTGTGYALNVIPGPGLEFVSKRVEPCTGPGCTQTVVYTFQALRKGKLQVTIYKGQFWDARTITSTVRYIVVD